MSKDLASDHSAFPFVTLQAKASKETGDLAKSEEARKGEDPGKGRTTKEEGRVGSSMPAPSSKAATKDNSKPMPKQGPNNKRRKKNDRRNTGGKKHKA